MTRPQTPKHFLTSEDIERTALGVLNRIFREKAWAYPEFGWHVPNYLWIQQALPKRNVAHDLEWQGIFGKFYGLVPFHQVLNVEVGKWVEQNWHCRSGISYETAIRELYNAGYGVHGSFASKALATLNPNIPPMDSNVLDAILPSVPDEKGHLWQVPRGALLPDAKIQRWENLHHAIVDIYSRICKQSRFQKKVAQQFRKSWGLQGKRNCTDVKIVDFLLWRIGARSNAGYLSFSEVQ